MARSRNIKPGFFQNDQLAEHGPYAQLLFAGLWTIADREGRLEDRPKRIKINTLPYYDVDIDDLLTKLHDSGFIHRYKVGNENYIQINTFDKHQNPHKNECDSNIVAPDEYSESTVQEQEQHDTNRADSLNTDSLNTDSLDTLKGARQRPPSIPYDEIIERYHKILPNNPAVEKLTAKRKAHIKARWVSELTTLEQWENYFSAVSGVKFLTGLSPPGKDRTKPFIANIDFLIREDILVKIAEGFYKD